MARVDEVIGYGLHAARPAAGSTGSLYYETDTTTLFRDNGTTWDELTLAGGGAGSGLYSAYLCYQEHQAAGVDAGGSTASTWQTRVLNTEVADTGNHGTLASNQITLDAGTYRVQASAPAYKAGANQLRLQNVTDAVTLLTGQAIYDTDVDNVRIAPLVGRFTLSAAKTIALQHYMGTAQAGNGLGNSLGQVTEVYASVELWKES